MPTPTTTLPSTTVTLAARLSCNLDLVFVVDSSYLLTSATYWQPLLTFLTDIVNALTIGPTNTQIGFVVIGWPASSKFYLNTYSTKSDVINAIQALSYVPQWTYTASGLHEATYSQFSTARGDRSSYANVALVVMGTATDQFAASIPGEAQASASLGNVIYAVGATSLVNSTEVQLISSSPRQLNTNYFLTSSPSQLASLENSILSNMCGQSSIG